LLIDQAREHPDGCRVAVLDEHARDFPFTGTDVAQHAFNEPGFISPLAVRMFLTVVMLVFFHAGQIVVMLMSMLMLMLVVVVFVRVVACVTVHAPYASQVSEDKPVYHVVSGL